MDGFLIEIGAIAKPLGRSASKFVRLQDRKCVSRTGLAARNMMLCGGWQWQRFKFHEAVKEVSEKQHYYPLRLHTSGVHRSHPTG